jgi:3'-phosphoadenosine 5'-phosphosulfate (PAPS) 3'-phosphatase
LSEFEIAKELNLSSKESIEAILMSSEVSDSIKRYWTVDPIDGTKGFIRGDQYSICIALIDRETELPLLSALGCPNLLVDGEEERGMLMVSVASVGNFVCKLGQSIEELKLLPKLALQTDLSLATFTGAVVSSHTNPLEIDAIKANYGNHVPVIRMDSQCKYGLLALNRAHVYYRRHASKDSSVRKNWKCDYIEAIWDNAPGYLLVKEAGGQVTDFEGNDLRFPPSKHFKVVGGILASMLEPELHAKVVKIVQDRNPIE